MGRPSFRNCGGGGSPVSVCIVLFPRSSEILSRGASAPPPPKWMKPWCAYLDCPQETGSLLYFHWQLWLFEIDLKTGRQESLGVLYHINVFNNYEAPSGPWNPAHAHFQSMSWQHVHNYLDTSLSVCQDTFFKQSNLKPCKCKVTPNKWAAPMTS